MTSRFVGISWYFQVFQVSKSSGYPAKLLTYIAGNNNNDKLTFLKSISCVTRVPSDLWNSRVIVSSVTFDDIVSKSISPPYIHDNNNIY